MGPLFQNGLKRSRTLNKIASKSGLKSSNIEKRGFSTKNDLGLSTKVLVQRVSTYKAQNAYVSGSNLPL